jgi:hypothetical protein
MRWESRSLKLPNCDVINLEKSKQDVYILLLPDKEDVNLLENEKEAFGQAFGIAP